MPDSQWHNSIDLPLTELNLTRFSVDYGPEAIFWLSKDGRLIYANKAACTSLGYSRQELLSMTVHDIDPHFPPEKWPAHWKNLKKNGAAIIESEHLSKDGRCFPVEIRINHLEFEGKEFHCAFVRDISCRLQNEQQLRRSEERFRLTMDATSDGMWDRDLQTGQVYYGENWGAILGYSDEEVRTSQLTWEKLLHPDDREDALQSVRDHLEGKTLCYETEFRMLNRQGGYQWLRARGKVVERDSKGRPLRFVGTHTDITGRKQAQEELKKSTEKVKMFAYSVAHDLRSPATAIHGMVSRVLKKVNEISRDSLELYCTQMLKSSEDLVQLVEKINTYISAKETPLNLTDISLREVVRIIRDEYSVQFNIRNIRWVEPDTLPAIKADRVSILRVLRNFLDNSLKYGGEQLSRIELDFKESEECFTLSVQDNGIGLKKEESKGIFGPFRRTKTSMGICGTGLGLAIVKEIAEQHGGEVWTEHNLTKGITFCFSISKLL